MVKSGEIKTCLISSELIELGGQQYVLSALQDISDRINAEKAVRASEKKFSTAFHTSPDAININRLSDGLYIEVNEGFAK